MKSITMKEMFPSLTDAQLYASEMKYDISKAIYLKRKEKNMSQKEFAKFMDVSQGMVSKWESFNYNFTIDSISEIFSKLDLKLKVSIESDINNYKNATTGHCKNITNWKDVIQMPFNNYNIEKAV